MGSLLIKIGILVEVFAAGVMLWSSVYLIQNFQKRGRHEKDVLLIAIFFLFFIHIGLSFFSQIYYSLDQPLTILALLQKVSAIILLAASFFLIALINTHSRIRGDKTVLGFLCLVFCFLSFRIWFSPITMIYGTDGIDPRVIYGALRMPYFDFDSVKMIWFGLFGLLGIVRLINYLFYKPEEKGDKALAKFSGVSAFLLLIGYIIILFYYSFDLPIFFLLSWVFILFGGIGIGLGEVILPEIEMSLHPLDYFRSRVLFKLIFGFTLIIIILFGGTNIIAVEINKTPLRKNVYERYGNIAEEMIAKIESREEITTDHVYKVVSTKRIGRSGAVFVVDQDGALIAKPPWIRLRSQNDLSYLYSVRLLLNGGSGSGDYYDASGEQIVFAFKSFTKARGGVIVQEKAREAFSEIRKLEIDSLINLIAGMVLAIIVTLFFAGTIEKPLVALKEGTDAVAAGDLNHRVETHSIDEFGTLAQAYNKMTHELKETQNRLILSEKMIALGNMAAGMAHEIRNPLVSLRTFTELLSSQWENKDFRSKFLTIVPREIERINRIAESLLRFGRPWKAEARDVKIPSVIEEVLLLFEPEMKKKNVTLKINYSEVPVFIGDAAQLVQAFTNIIKNAIEAMGDRGGGELNIETEYLVAVKLRKDEYSPNEMTWGFKMEEKPYVIIKVTDTGGGIPKGKMRNLFDPFFTSKTYGTGMGLPITLRIIEDHRGTIKVINRPNEGTIFMIYIPLEGKIKGQKNV